MAATKRKILEAARKFAQKGATAKALKEYKKLLKLDPRDAKLRLEVGDAYRRWGQVDEAVDTYQKVAEQYMAEGFDARAVAVFKQLVNLDPERHGAYEPLADLYLRMGLTSEAIGALQVAADAYHRAGQKTDALNLLRKMATLDPTNTASRIKVADLLHQEGLASDALAEYDEALDELERQGDHEALQSVCERILAIDAHRTATLRQYAQSLLRSGAADRAEPFARRALEGESGEPQHYELLLEIYQSVQREDALADTYRGLADLYRQRGDEDRAREILQRFVPPDEFGGPVADFADDDVEIGDAEIGVEDLHGASDSTLLTEDSIVEPTDVGRADLVGEETAFDAAPDDAGDTAILGEDYLPDDPFGEAVGSEGETRFEPLPCLDEIPLEAPALETPQPDPAAAPRFSAEEIDQVLAEASVYLRYGKRAQAVESLEQIVAQQPLHRGALEKLGEALAESGDITRAVESWMTAAQLARDSGEIGVLGVLRDRIAALDAEAAASLDDGEIGAASFDDDAEDYLEIPNHVTERSIEAAVEAASSSVAPEPAMAAESAPGLDSSADEDIEIDDEFLDELEFEPSDFENDLGEVTSSGAVPSVGSDDTADPDALSATSQQIQEDLEEADFYSQQGLSDEAEAIYKRLLAIAPNHPRVLVRLGEIAAARGDDPGSTAALRVGNEESAAPPTAGGLDLLDDSLEGLVADATPADAAGAHDDIQTGEFEIEIADAAELDAPAPLFDAEEPDFEDSAVDGVEIFFDESEPVLDDVDEHASSIPALEDAAFASQPPLAISQPLAPDLAGNTPASEQSLDAPLASGFEAVEGGFDLAAEINDAIDEESSGASVSRYGESGADDGFSEVFREFKKGVNESLKEGDHEAHYDLGIAYREMGLLEDAIAEFRLASQGAERRIGSLHMMGMCALDGGRAPEAVNHFASALDSGSLTGDQELAIRFELGRAFRTSGDVVRARDAFEAVAAINPLFRDVEGELVLLEEEDKPRADAAEADSGYESFDDFLAGTSDDPPLDATDIDVEPAPADSAAKRRRKISFS